MSHLSLLRRLQRTQGLFSPLAFLVAALIFILTGCSHYAAPSEGSLIVRSNGPEPDSLDPQKALSNEAQGILRDLCEGLTALDRDAAVTAGVAQHYSVSQDGKTYTFTLRPQARWSDGARIVATDFVSALRRVVDPATASGYADVFNVITHATAIQHRVESPDRLGVYAPDPSTVIVNLVSPTPYLPQLLAHPSACPFRAATPSDSGAAKRAAAVYSGAFTLREWVPGSHALLVRNKYYWNDAQTGIDGVKYLFLADENAELLRYRAGELQITSGIPRGQLTWAATNLVGQLHVSPVFITYFYGFNLDKYPFKDNQPLRRALSLTVDREKLTRLVLRAGEVPAYSWVPPGLADYTPPKLDYQASPLSDRIAEAKHLYARAGYSSQHPLRFELRYNAGDTHEKVALAVSSMWKEALGVEVTLIAEEHKTLLVDIEQGNTQMFRSSWAGDFADAYSFAQYFDSNFGINMPHYRNPQYDALLDRSSHEIDQSIRKKLLQDAESLLLTDLPIIPLYVHVNKHLVSPRVHGWYDNVMGVTYSKHLSLAKSPSPRTARASGP